MSQNENDPLLTTEEVAAELRLGRSAIHKLLRSGELPSINLGHRTKRVRRSELEKFIAEREGAGNGISPTT